VKETAGLKSWPWIGLSGVQFWSAKEIKLFARNRAEQRLHISPVLISEGVTSIREAVRAGLGVAVLPDFLIREDLLSGQLVRVWRNGARKTYRFTSSRPEIAYCRRACAPSSTSPSAK
jgi:DNA-binding transcriptional LysR family regulator